MSAIERENLIRQLNQPQGVPTVGPQTLLHKAKNLILRKMSDKSLGLKGQDVINATNLEELARVAARRRTGQGGTRSLKALAQFVTENRSSFASELKEQEVKGSRITQRGLRYLAIHGQYNHEMSRSLHKLTERHFSAKIQSEMDKSRSRNTKSDVVIPGMDSSGRKHLEEERELVPLFLSDEQRILMAKNMAYSAPQESLDLANETFNRSLSQNTKSLKESVDLSRITILIDGENIDANEASQEAQKEAAAQRLENTLKPITNPEQYEQIMSDIGYLLDQRLISGPHGDFLTHKKPHSLLYPNTANGVTFYISPKVVDGKLQSIDIHAKLEDGETSMLSVMGHGVIIMDDEDNKNYRASFKIDTRATYTPPSDEAPKGPGRVNITAYDMEMEIHRKETHHSSAVRPSPNHPKDEDDEEESKEGPPVGLEIPSTNESSYERTTYHSSLG